jgi:DNA-binding response OmpR family regulator
VSIGDGAATLLSALALAPGRRLEHWQLIEALREDAANYTTAALGVRVVRLRQLLRQVGFEGATVRAVRLEGYQLCVPITVA